jgi:hypothetical protein
VGWLQPGLSEACNASSRKGTHPDTGGINKYEEQEQVFTLITWREMGETVKAVILHGIG